MTGSLENWPDDLFFTIHDYWQHSLIRHEFITHAQAAVACDHDKLYVVAWSLDGSVRNAADDPRTLFKHGEALDVTLGMDPHADPKRTAAVAGDLRILISQVKGEKVAVLYRPVAPDAPAELQYNFTSPVGITRMDASKMIPDAEIAIKYGKLAQRHALDHRGRHPVEITRCRRPPPWAHGCAATWASCRAIRTACSR